MVSFWAPIRGVRTPPVIETIIHSCARVCCFLEMSEHDSVMFACPISTLDKLLRVF